MAEIIPFKALRYDPNQVRLDDVVTQPYDKITPEMQTRYYEACPHNLVRIELGRAGETDRDDFNIYTRAAEYLHDWREAGLLCPDPQPSLYLHNPNFTPPRTSNLNQ